MDHSYAMLWCGGEILADEMVVMRGLGELRGTTKASKADEPARRSVRELSDPVEIMLLGGLLELPPPL